MQVGGGFFNCTCFMCVSKTPILVEEGVIKSPNLQEIDGLNYIKLILQTQRNTPKAFCY